jgi:FKBP-type peptidyl-prolyl cis-trans isomerase (trigger factor)
MGAKVGDVIDCDVTFPDNYGNSDLAGKDVVFTFTINSIQRVMEVADADDAFAQEQFSVDTVEEMYTQIEEYLVQLMDYYKVQNTLTAIQEYLIENCEANVPDDYLEARLSDYIRSYVENNCDGDESQLEDIASSYYDTDADGLKEQWRESMRESIQLELIMDAITEELGLTIDEDAYAEYVSTLISNSSSYSDEDSMYEYYGYGDRAYGETYFRKLYLYDRALDEVEATAVVTIRPEDEDPDAETDETEATETLEDTEE